MPLRQQGGGDVAPRDQAEVKEGVSSQENPPRLPGVPFEVKRISADTDPENWLQMGQQRAKSYVFEKHYLGESNLDERGAEFDEYDSDPNTSHYVVVDGADQVLASARTIYRTDPKGEPLPSEEIFSLDTAAGPAREISRLITDREKLADTHRRSSHYLKLYLVRCMTQEAVSRPQAGPLYAVMERPLLADLDRLGMTMDVVGEPIFTEKYNSENILVSFRSEAMTSGMHQADCLRSQRHPRIKERFGPFMEKNKSSLGAGRIALEHDFLTSPAEQYQRNFGWMTDAEFVSMDQSTVAIAGAGGDGGALAVQLARMGVRKFRLADPEPFELENLNRQEGASYRTIGENKAEVIARLVQDIQPHAEISLFTDGVTPENVVDFIQGSDLVIDETEYTRHEVGVLIARESRRQNIPVLMVLNVGFGSYITSFHPRGVTLEKYLGLSEDMSLERISECSVPLSKWVPHIPSYSDMGIFGRIGSAQVSAPTVVPGVGIAASHAAFQALAHLAGESSPLRQRGIRFAPRGQAIDLVDGLRNVRHPSVHFAMSGLVALVRTKLGKNPRMSY